jgi:hypothetical protein
MSDNTILTPTAVTREALRVLHAKSTFLSSINKQYDSSFAQEGAKIGDSLKIRLPNQYTVRSGINMAAQSTVETSTTLQVATVKGVDLNFTSQELTLSLDDFSKRILEPAMSVLAANIEADVLGNVIKDVYQSSNNVAAAITLANVGGGRKKLQDALVPDERRNCLLSTNDNLNLVDALKALFNPSTNTSAQYRDGVMGHALGFDFMESTHLVNQARGAGANYVVNGANQTGSTITIGTGTGLIDVGSIITFAGCNRVHPETKVDTGILQQFTVVSTNATNATTVTISPAIVTSGATQNVAASPTNTGAVTILGTASTPYGQSLVYHEDAFTFATADLAMPKGVDFAAREVMDGISMSIVRDFSISDRTFPCRVDVLYGYKTLRAQMACRLANLAGS